MEESAGRPRPTIWRRLARGPRNRAPIDVRLSLRLFSRAHVLWALRRPIHRPALRGRAHRLPEATRSQDLRADAWTADERVRLGAPGRRRARRAARRLAS